MVEVKCIDKRRDKSNNIIAYKLVDTQGVAKILNPEELKKRIKANQLNVVNLTLTKDDRLIDKKEKTELRIRNVSADICGLFEDLLSRFNIYIPDEDRTGDESEACIYGMEYSNLEDDVTEILVDLCKKLKANPNVKINAEEY